MIKLVLPLNIFDMWLTSVNYTGQCDSRKRLICQPFKTVARFDWSLIKIDTASIPM